MLRPTDATFVSDQHEAMVNQALGYAWGMADATGTPAEGRSHWVSPALAFARAFADARENRANAPSLHDAWRAWQGSEGTRVT